VTSLERPTEKLKGPVWVSLKCAGGCGRTYRAAPAVRFIVCGRECCGLARIREKRRSA